MIWEVNLYHFNILKSSSTFIYCFYTHAAKYKSIDKLCVCGGEEGVLYNA